MTRQCAQCKCYMSRNNFSSNQWRKGDGISRCANCINGVFVCNECDRTFKDKNALMMHMQVHRPRSVACPICGEERFRSGANAVQHVESGFCRGCKGEDNARKQIYKFASRQAAMRPFMTSVPQITYGGYDCDSVPSLPYQCKDCSKSFRQLSQLLQHQDQKHRNPRMLTY